MEPCCVDKKLPPLLRQQGTVFFQTSGDVTVEKLMRAVGSLVESPSEMWLMAERVDVELLRVVRHWFLRGWIDRLKLLTKEDCKTAVEAELGGDALAAVAQQQTGQVEYGCDAMVTDGLLCFVGKEKAVAVQGRMTLGVSAGMMMYGAVFGSRAALLDKEDGRIKGMTEAFLSRLRMKKGK